MTLFSYCYDFSVSTKPFCNTLFQVVTGWFIRIFTRLLCRDPDFEIGNYFMKRNWWTLWKIIVFNGLWKKCVTSGIITTAVKKGYCKTATAIWIQTQKLGCHQSKKLFWCEDEKVNTSSLRKALKEGYKEI